MEDDERCCGTGTCIIDDRGRCWCGQEWDGEKMCRAPQDETPVETLGEMKPADAADTP